MLPIRRLRLRWGDLDRRNLAAFEEIRTQCATPMGASRRLSFDPVTDGFSFVNRFAWTHDDLVQLSGELRLAVAAAGASVTGAAAGAAGGRRAVLPGALVGGALGATLGAALVVGLARRWPEFGLCGGMASAAIERWGNTDGRPTAELDRDEVRDLLRRRQGATIRSAGARFVGYWLGARLLGGDSISPPFGAALAREAERAKRMIDAGRPVVLGLVGNAPDPFEMHQVVAFGYRDQGGETRFDVYDPNAPGAVRHVTTATDHGRTRVTTDLPTGPGRRGFHLSKVPGRLGMVFVVS